MAAKEKSKKESKKGSSGSGGGSRTRKPRCTKGDACRNKACPLYHSYQWMVKNGRIKKRWIKVKLEESGIELRWKVVKERLIETFDLTLFLINFNLFVRNVVWVEYALYSLYNIN